MRYFTFHCRRRNKGETTEALKRILLVEDDPKDIELTLNLLDENNLGNKVEVARDRVEALVNEPPPGSVKR